MIYIHFQPAHLRFKVKIVLVTAQLKCNYRSPSRDKRKKYFTHSLQKLKSQFDIIEIKTFIYFY